MLMRTVLCLSVAAASAAFSPAAGRKPSLTQAKSSFLRTPTVRAQSEPPSLYEEYLRKKEGGDGAPMEQQAPPEQMPPAQMPPPPNYPFPGEEPPPSKKSVLKGMWDAIANGPEMDKVPGMPADALARPSSDSDSDYERIPWWRQGSAYSETQRKDRRTIFMHDDWVRHRSSERFLRNIKTIGSSGINQALASELTFVTSTAVFVVLMNMLFANYQDFSGVVHPGPLAPMAANIKTLSLPALPFSIAMPALSLLLVFRTNTGYSRWNEARTLWGGLINNCRNVVRQCNTFFPDDPYHNELKQRMAAETGAFIRSLRNFLRGPTDDDVLRSELYDYVEKGTMTQAQAEATMAASNRPIFCLAALSATLRKADIDTMQKARIDSTISILVDLTGANERIFKSPIPLVYTRLLSRFLVVFLTLLPLALWGQMGESWNHWATIPATFVISFFLFGIEEVGIQTEEPFSILPLEAFCNGAISATNQEMLNAEEKMVFEQR